MFKNKKSLLNKINHSLFHSYLDKQKQPPANLSLLLITRIEENLLNKLLYDLLPESRHSISTQVDR